MQAATHILFGAGSALLVSAGQPLEVMATATGAAIIGSLLPDLDHTGGYLSRRLPPLSWIVSGLFGHRKATHSLLAGLLVFLAGWSLGGFYGVCVAIGYLSHLAADMLTPAGVLLFWPATRPVGVPRLLAIRTGGRLEGLLALLLLVAVLVQWWYLLA